LNSLAIAALLVLVAILFGVVIERADDIQDSRVAFTAESCRQQNMRHDVTIRKLDQLIADLPPGTQKRRARRGRESTVALIDALAPERDCRAVVRRIELDD
jgi:hypothetical protein